MIEAVVYVPDDLEGDGGLYARQGIAHAERNGYRIAGVMRKAEHVLTLAAEGAVVVVAKLAHARSLKTNVKHELVGEETCGLIPFFVGGELVSRQAGLHNEVTAYRSGYADGYLDSTTMRTAKRRQGWRG